jgi:hypothetical protein
MSERCMLVHVQACFVRTAVRDHVAHGEHAGADVGTQRFD